MDKIIYSKHWVNVGMNHHLLLRQAAYEYLGIYKYQGMIFSKTKTREICNRNCFLYTIVSFVLSRFDMAAVEKCFNTTVLCSEGIQCPIWGFTCTEENYLEVNFLQEQIQSVRWKSSSFPPCPWVAGPTQQQPLTSLIGKTPHIPLGVLNHFLSVTPGTCLFLFFTSCLWLCTLAADFLFAVFIPHYQFHQLLQKQHPAVCVWWDYGEHKLPGDLGCGSQDKSQRGLFPGGLASVFLKIQWIWQNSKNQAHGPSQPPAPHANVLGGEPHCTKEISSLFLLYG